MLININPCEVEFQDLVVSIALSGHGVGAPLAHAHVVAPAGAADGKGVARRGEGLGSDGGDDIGAGAAVHLGDLTAAADGVGPDDGGDAAAAAVHIVFSAAGDLVADGA
ncbi:hypothetical protein SDC9_162508 [bioreactor metagenome]|uniref:Uncharacterized protein n=1 Tax=bioreactor metagenome TaxID=1076179 RepID=A0A645FP99_9ZZZZ